MTAALPYPSELRIKSAMTELSCLTLWFPAYAGMTVRGVNK